MDFEDNIKLLAIRTLYIKDQIVNKESAKLSFIIPLIRALGYDVFDPSELSPDFTIKSTLDKIVKIDFVIKIEASPIISIACTHPGIDLDQYYIEKKEFLNLETTKFIIFSNGIRYMFFTDLEKDNKIDLEPFLDINFADIKTYQIKELEKFHKSNFSMAIIKESAHKSIQINKIRGLLIKELDNPSPNLIKFLQTENLEIVQSSEYKSNQRLNYNTSEESNLVANKELNQENLENPNQNPIDTSIQEFKIHQNKEEIPESSEPPFPPLSLKT